MRRILNATPRELDELSDQIGAAVAIAILVFFLCAFL